MKMTVALPDVESLDGEKAVSQKSTAEARKRHEEETAQAKAQATKPQAGETAATAAIRTERNTLDIRGSRVADAEPLIERAIAQAHAAGVLWIIHGHGTGKLRQGVHEFLQQHPQVERFQLADRVDGGAGVTVVYLR